MKIRTFHELSEMSTVELRSYVREHRLPITQVAYRRKGELIDFILGFQLRLGEHPDPPPYITGQATQALRSHAQNAARDRRERLDKDEARKAKLRR